ncbi:MAG: PD-(D/E)XK nuclease family protein [Patescibacteria group bacterium]
MTKLSRSKIDLFLKCPRCFWLDVKHGVKRPPPAPYTINSAIDYLLKQEFDIYREKGKPHPIMVKAGIDAVPYKSEHLNTWRHNFTGVQHHYEPMDFLVFGAVDDVWVNPQGELMVVDYKATGARQHQVYDDYKRQMEIYQWLLAQNKFKVSPTGYFVFARVNKANGFSPPAGGEPVLSFDIFVEPYSGDYGWLPGVLAQAKGVLNEKSAPAPGIDCEYCHYRDSARAAIV